MSEGDIAVNNLLRTRLGALRRREPAGCRKKPKTTSPAAHVQTRLDRRSDRRHARLSSPAARTGPFRWRWSRTAGRSAALYAPVTDEMFLAMAGAGAHLQRRGDGGEFRR